MKNFKLCALLLSSYLILFFAGCASVTPISNEPISGEKVVYIIPKNADIMKTHSILTYISLNPSLSKFSEPSSTCCVYKVSGTELREDAASKIMYVTNFNGQDFFNQYNGTTRYSSYVKYTVQVELTDDASNYILALYPNQKESVQGSDVIGLVKYPVPYFSLSDLLTFLGSGAVTFKVEVDSPYNTESIYANFKRYLKEETYAEGYKDPVTGKIFKSSFLMTLGNTAEDARLFVETYPYRNGTKAVVTVSCKLHPGSMQGNQIDVGAQIAQIAQEIERIVKS